MIALLLLVGCGQPGVVDEIELSCDGMVRDLVLYWKTATLARDERSGTLNPRCLFAPSPEGLTGGPVTLTSEWFPPEDQMVIRVAARGKLYYSTEGTAELSAYEPGKAAGTFETEAQAYDLTTEEWDPGTTTIRGDFDWCSAQVHPDCPSGYEDVLGRPMTLYSPAMAMGDVQASASACRMLWDRQTGGLQVDLAIGYWAGHNVGQLWVSECTGGEGPIVPNAFTFRAAGVTGPGTYGPVDSRTFPTGRLPELRWTHPKVFASPYVSSPAVACTEYWGTAEAWLTDRSACSWTVDAGQGGVGHFSLQCSNVEHQSEGGLFQLIGSGDFRLDTVCDWQER